MKYVVKFARSFHQGNSKIDEFLDFNKLDPISARTLVDWMMLLNAGVADTLIENSTNKITWLPQNIGKKSLTRETTYWHFHCGGDWDDSDGEKVRWDSLWSLRENIGKGSAQVIHYKKSTDRNEIIVYGFSRKHIPFEKIEHKLSGVDALADYWHQAVDA